MYVIWFNMPLFVPESKRYQYSSRRRKSAVVYEVIRKYKGIILFSALLSLIAAIVLTLIFNINF
jgi:hypothetical protein